jgi:hypothetical protein
VRPILFHEMSVSWTELVVQHNIAMVLTLEAVPVKAASGKGADNRARGIEMQTEEWCGGRFFWRGGVSAERRISWLPLFLDGGSLPRSRYGCGNGGFWLESRWLGERKYRTPNAEAFARGQRTSNGRISIFVGVASMKTFVFAVLSLAPSLSWVRTGGSTTEPLQRFIRHRKPLKRLKTMGAPTTQLKLGANKIGSQGARFLTCAHRNFWGKKII